MKPMIWGADPDLLNTDPHLKGLARFAATQHDRKAFAQLVVKNLGNPARLLAAVNAHQPGKTKTTQQNQRKLQALLRGVPLPPSKPSNTATRL